MKKSKRLPVRIIQTQGAQFNDKWYVLVTGENGKCYMANHDPKTDKWSDWTEIKTPLN